MSERMTSPDEFREMRAAFNDLLNNLERRGMARGQIAVGLIGYATAVVQVHYGHKFTMEIVETVQTTMAGLENLKN